MCSEEEGDELYFTSSDVDESPPPKKIKDIDDYDDSSFCEEDDTGIYPSSDSEIAEKRQVVTPQKHKIRINDTWPAGDTDTIHCSGVLDNTEYQSEQDTRSECSHVDDICSNYASDDNMSSNSSDVEKSTLGCSNSDLSSDNSGSDYCQDFSEEMHGGSTLTSSNFDALLLAFFKKHSISEADKKDMLKLLELALPTSSNVATSSYMFNKRHKECILPFELKELLQ